MSKKYSLLLDEPKEAYGRFLYRIKAEIDIPEWNVKAGDKGGWIESEENLSQEDSAWVTDDARVYENAQIFGNARISEYAWVHGNALIYDNAQVCGSAEVYDDARVYGNAEVRCGARIYDEARVYGDVVIGGITFVGGEAGRIYSQRR